MVVSNIRGATTFKQTVLIIDNQSTVLDIHTAILKSVDTNLNIVTMTDPVAALAWMGRKQIDLIVTGFGMLHMDGMEFVETINKANNAGPTPIIVITVLKDKELHKELLAAGAAACLTKPVKSVELAKVAQFLLTQNKAFYNHKLAATN